MTRIIDIESRAMERDTYRPLFRLSDIDRRRDRKVVVRPNDGPGDLARRFQLAEERRDALARRMHRMARNGETYEQAQLRNRLLTRRLILEALYNRGRLTLEEIADATGIDLGAVSHYTHTMGTDGLLTKARLGNLSTPYACTITDAGLAFLEEAGQ